MKTQFLAAVALCMLATAFPAFPQGKGGGGGGGGGGSTPPPNPEIAFVDTSLKVMNADGTNVRTVVSVGKREQVRFPCWSSDGQSLVYFGYHTGGAGLHTVRLDGTQRTRIVPTSSGTIAFAPDWSRQVGPTGQRMIAFVTAPPGDDANELYVVNPNGTQLTNISQSFGVMEDACAWSADGSRVYCSRFIGDIQNPLFELVSIQLGLDGSGNVVKVSESVVYQAWGAEFFYMRSANNFDGLVFSNLMTSTAMGIRTLDLGSTSPAPATVTTGSSDRWPSFSPDDSKIAFYRSGSGGGIFTVNASGTGLVRVSSKGIDPNWKRPAPGGP